MSKAELKKKTYENGKLSNVMEIARIMQSKHSAKWVKEDNLVVDKDGEYLAIMFPSTDTGNFEFEYNAKGEKILLAIEKKIAAIIVESDIKDSVFSPFRMQDISSSSYINIGKNKDVLVELDKIFKANGIEKVGIYDKCGSNVNNMVNEKLSIVFKPYNSEGRSIKADTNKLRDHYSKVKGYITLETSGEPVAMLKKEKDVILKVSDLEIGRYYPERNLILIWFNPFYNINLSELETIYDNEFIEATLTDIFKAIKDAKAKTIDITDMKVRLVVSEFNQLAKKSLSDLRKRKEATARDIISYESRLIEMFSEAKSLSAQIDAISVIEEDNISSFMEEIKKTKEQAIVDDVKIEDNKVKITFIPTTIPIDFKRDLYDKKSHGMRHIYLGRITLEIGGAGNLIVTSDCMTLNKNPHPHGNDNGNPCLGTGDGPNTIHKLIGERKFSDLVYVFWMWIKRWRTEDCYVKPWDFYDDRLRQGLPIFDDNGNRIEINDKERIKTGEQIQLKKHDNWESNQAKYKDFKLTK